MNILGGLFNSLVNNAEGILDKVVTTDKERDAAKIELKKLLLEAEREAERERRDQEAREQAPWQDEAWSEEKESEEIGLAVEWSDDDE